MKHHYQLEENTPVQSVYLKLAINDYDSEVEKN